jgi:hypothetical protein
MKGKKESRKRKVWEGREKERNTERGKEIPSVPFPLSSQYDQRSHPYYLAYRALLGYFNFPFTRNFVLVP